jgi:hypothetical protein
MATRVAAVEDGRIRCTQDQVRLSAVLRRLLAHPLTRDLSADDHPHD